MSTLDMTEWTEVDKEIANDLGISEMTRRAGELDSYDRYETVASAYGMMNMTPRQMKAWASFAETLGPDMVVTGQEIKREKDTQGKIESVIRRERYARERIAREARQAAERADQDRNGGPPDAQE